MDFTPVGKAPLFMLRSNLAASVTALTAMAATLLLAAPGCAVFGPPKEPPKSLYERLGGEPGITLVVDDFFSKCVADPALNFTRRGHTNHWDGTTEEVIAFKKHLVQFIEAHTGGPQKYEGRDMAVVHTGMDISQSEWEVAVADLKAAMTDNKVGDKEQNELITIIAGTHDSIVGK